jgi:hypothetical protein
VDGGRSVRLTTSLLSVSRLCRQCGTRKISQTYRPPRLVMCAAFFFFVFACVHRAYISTVVLAGVLSIAGLPSKETKGDFFVTFLIKQFSVFISFKVKFFVFFVQKLVVNSCETICYGHSHTTNCFTLLQHYLLWYSTCFSSLGGGSLYLARHTLWQ